MSDDTLKRSHVVRIDPEVLAALKQHALDYGLQDASPNRVVRRLLGLADRPDARRWPPRRTR